MGLLQMGCPYPKIGQYISNIHWKISVTWSFGGMSVSVYWIGSQGACAFIRSIRFHVDRSVSFILQCFVDVSQVGFNLTPYE